MVLFGEMDYFGLFCICNRQDTMKKAIIVILCVWHGIMWAQEPQTWEEKLDETGILDEQDEEGAAQIYDLLSELAEHKIDLNAATREDLLQLPFLTDGQVEELCEYLYRYGPMRSLGELAMIESLDYERRQLLLNFVYLSEKTIRGNDTYPSAPSQPKSEFVGDARIPLYRRLGDRDGYLGYPYKHSFRYALQRGKHFKAGLIGAQDGGEPFLANKNKWGYDYYSFYAIVKNVGRVKSLVTGRYRINMGMGLVMNGSIAMGKTSTLASAGQTATVIRPHSSRMEGNYLQGAAATVRLTNHVDATAFLSYRHIDATLNDDSTTIATIVKTGYHRTPTEMEKKHNATEGLAGAVLHYRSYHLNVGLTGVYDWFGKEIAPKTSQAYRQYYAAGKRFWNVGVVYGYSAKGFYINGETATGNSHALATINTIGWKATGDMTLLAVQRFYSYRYYALHGYSFSEGGSVQNESGIYIGADWHPNKRFQLKAYSDIAYFPWAKYQAQTASHSFDNSISATYQWGAFTVFGRYRLKMREKDNDDKTRLIYKKEHKARASVSYADGSWTAKATGDLAYTQYKKRSLGWMVSGNVGCKWKRWQANVNVAFFHTDDYDSRVYMYEKGPLYSFALHTFYGKGIHGSVLVRHDFNTRWMVMAKVGYTHYFDRDTIGTALQTIAHRWQSDIDIQCRWKF